MNVEELKHVILLGYRINRPVCALSSPGLGKSSIVVEAAGELSVKHNTPFEVIEIRGASASPSELATVKYVSAEQVVKDADQDWFPTNEKVKKNGCAQRGFIFCDEITSSLPMVQSTLQRLFLDRRLGNLVMADGWQAIAAGNRAKDKAAAGNLSRAFANRCMMVTVEPDADVFYKWGIQNGIVPEVLGFVRFKKDCLNDGLTITKTENQAFCSPRSMHIVSDAIKGMEGFPETLKPELFRGILGDGIGSEFAGFVRIMDNLPNLEDLIDDPLNYPVPKEIDVTWATIGALINRLNEETAKPIVQFVCRLTPDLATVATKDILAANKALEELITTVPEFIEWISINVNYMT